MMFSAKRITEKLNPENKLLWITLALFVKGIYYIGLVFFITKTPILGYKNPLFIWTGDAASYIYPLETFLREFNYRIDYRMPGYAMPYLLIRLVFDFFTSLKVLIAIQCIYSAISSYYLAKIALMIFKSRQIFYYTFFLYLSLVSINLYDWHIFTESLLISSTIFFIYFLLKFYESDRLNHIFIAGCFYAHAVFLKPVYLPLFIVSIIVLYFKWTNQKKVIKKIVISFVLFMITFLFLDLIWTTRNYYVHKKFNFLHNGYEYPSIENSAEGQVWRFCRDVGRHFSWENKDLFRWLATNPDSLGTEKMENIAPPNYIYTSEFNKDSLLKINKYFYEYNLVLYKETEDYLSQYDEYHYLINDKIDDNPIQIDRSHIIYMTSYYKEKHSPLKAKYENYIISKLKLYGDSFRKEKPFYYYVYAPIVLFIEFIDTAPGYRNWNIYSSPKKWIVLLSGVTYYFVFILGVFGLVYVLFKKNFRNDLPFILIFISGYSLLLFPIILRYSESRYLAPILPFFAILASFMLNIFVRRLVTLVKKT